jgi:hypothetical protein
MHGDTLDNEFSLKLQASRYIDCYSPISRSDLSNFMDSRFWSEFSLYWTSRRQKEANAYPTAGSSVRWTEIRFRKFDRLVVNHHDETTHEQIEITTRVGSCSRDYRKVRSCLVLRRRIFQPRKGRSFGITKPLNLHTPLISKRKSVQTIRTPGECVLLNIMLGQFSARDQKRF